jgi:hypothetical protein
MRLITLSIASLLSARPSGSSSAEPDEALLAQIPRAMLRQLLRRGWILEIEFLLFPVVMVFAAEIWSNCSFQTTT